MTEAVKFNPVHFVGFAAGATFIIHELSSRSFGIFNPMFIYAGALIYGIFLTLFIIGLIYKKNSLLKLLMSFTGTITVLIMTGVFLNLYVIDDGIFYLIAGLIQLATLGYYFKENYQNFLKYKQQVL